MKNCPQGVHLTMSTLTRCIERYFYKSLFGKKPGPKVTVPFNQVPALEHVRYRQTSLYLINAYLFFRCLEKTFEEERNQNKKGNSRGVTTT